MEEPVSSSSSAVLPRLLADGSDQNNNPLAGKIRLNDSIILHTWTLMCPTNHVVNSLSPQKEKRKEH
jgi:hypothetical protein